MTLRCVLFFCLAGLVFGQDSAPKRDEVPEEKRKDYVMRILREKEQVYRECMDSKNKTEEGFGFDDLECLQNSTIQALLPGRYVEPLGPSECVSKASSQIQRDWEVSGISDRFNFNRDYLDQDDLCYTLSVVIRSQCKAAKDCPAKEVQGSIERFATYLYSIQQFAHGGKDVEFNCKNQPRIRINPELYKPNLNITVDSKFLVNSISCDDYKPGGYVEKKDEVPEDKRKGYIWRLSDEKEPLYEECLASKNKTEEGFEFEDLECLQNSTLQTLLPAWYIKPLRPTECISKASSKFERDMEELGIRDKFNFKKDYLSEDDLCYVLDMVISSQCNAAKDCPSNERRGSAERLAAYLYSYQQFAHGGMDVQFNCKDQPKIRINPELYKPNLNVTIDSKFLVESINCKDYKSESDVQKKYKVPEDKRKGYIVELMREKEQVYKECIDSKNKTEEGIGFEDLECLQNSTLQAKLPFWYAKTMRPSECLFEAGLKFKDEMRKSGIFDKFAFKKDYLSKEDLCHVLSVAIPSQCNAAKDCPSNERQGSVDSLVTYLYSIQQFAHGGMNVEFDCRNLPRIRINPELYKPNLNVTVDSKFLVNSISCNAY